MQEIRKRWLTLVETAAYVGLSAKTIYNSTGPKSVRPFPVKPKRLGRRILFDIFELDRYLEGL